mmetsp:Transcript_5073/g.12187  ORF Transcript_5073/g.12187 Transcript_5073/m.12187 type:complete len:234 (+) Transcript_5073:182-883(+)
MEDPRLLLSLPSPLRASSFRFRSGTEPLAPRLLPPLPAEDSRALPFSRGLPTTCLRLSMSACSDKVLSTSADAWAVASPAEVAVVFQPVTSNDVWNMTGAPWSVHAPTTSCPSPFLAEVGLLLLALAGRAPAEGGRPRPLPADADPGRDPPPPALPSDSLLAELGRLVEGCGERALGEEMGTGRPSGVGLPADAISNLFSHLFPQHTPSLLMRSAPGSGARRCRESLYSPGGR